MQDEAKQENKMEENLKYLYTRSVVNSLGSGMVNPFMGAYAVELGASSSEMGWFQSSINLSTNVMQIFWGRLSDKLKRRIPFIILGGIIIAILWIPMIFITNATQLIVLLAVQALLGSMATPAWTALLGDFVPPIKLGRINAAINLWASVGSLVATIVSGVILVTAGGTLQQIFLVPFLVATICGIISSLMMLKVKEKKQETKRDWKETDKSSFFDMLAYARKNRDFVKYCSMEAFYVFFMSLIWPLISITQIRVLNATMLHIALITFVQYIATIVFQSWAGRLCDTRGRKLLILYYRFSLVTVPLAYAFVPDINMLIIVSTFWGVSTALGQTSMTVYLLDVAPQEHRGSFAAIFNLISGAFSFSGSLIGGYLADYTTTIFGLVAGLQIIYMISAAGRIIGSVLHLKLRETLKRQTR
ncbi:MAG: MFS transporter [Candidatus Bathyarchaeales archaeon]